MSITETKRSLREAGADAEAFRALFPADSYERWEIAGSIRRRKPLVSDVEHVVIPKFGDVPAEGLFAEPVTKNLLWHFLDAMDADPKGVATKHVYHTTKGDQFRWGDRYRGVDFRGFNHEIFISEIDCWGSTLTIRTGPADFSQRMVSQLYRSRHRNHEGHVWSCITCGHNGEPKDGCKLCEGTGLAREKKIPVVTERRFFELAGMVYIEPERRM